MYPIFIIGDKWMNKYSPISRIIIKDFRTIQDVQIDFSESPIIALVGGNDVGKSSILKAFEVCALHYNSRGQKGYIRTGAPFFGVGIQLADGSSIVRLKTKDNINKYEVRYPDGTVWNTTKISEGLPVQVSELMGMMEEPETREYLQVRTYEDQLLMAYTPASTNYKVMYDALKVGQITRAIRRGTDEANSKRQEIIDNASSIRALENNMKRIDVLDLSSIVEIKEAIRGAKERLEKIELAVDILDKMNELEDGLGVIKLIDTYKLESINELEASMFMGANIALNYVDKIGKELSSISEIDNLIQINEVQAININIAVDVLKKMEDIVRERGLYGEIDRAEEISETTVQKMGDCMRVLSSIESLKKQYGNISEVNSLQDMNKEAECSNKMQEAVALIEKMTDIEKSIQNTNMLIDDISNKMKASGAIVGTCPNCGTDVIMEG